MSDQSLSIKKKTGERSGDYLAGAEAAFQAVRRCPIGVGLMLGQRRRRWANIKVTLVQWLMCRPTTRLSDIRVFPQGFCLTWA